MPPALEVRDLHAYYGESHVLQGVSLDVDRGECVAMLGCNGAGKTTTIAAIVGFVRPRSGSVRVQGAEVAGRAPHQVAAAGLALVPHGRRGFGDLSVRENLTLTARPAARGGDPTPLLAPFPPAGERPGSSGGQFARRGSRRPG